MLRRLAAGSAVLFLFLFLPAPLRADDAGTKNQFFDSAGVKIRYLIEGNKDGEPVVLIHGLAANVEIQWTTIRAELGKDYRIIALDLRGHGLSGKPHESGKYGPELAEDVIRLLDHLHVKKAHVVGYSLGGAVALHLAVRYPDRVLSATLGGMGVPKPPGGDATLRDLADSLEKGDKGEGFKPLLVYFHPRDDRLEAVKMEAANRFLMQTTDLKAMAALVRSLRAKEAALTDDQLKTLKVPILAIVGDKDPFKEGVDELKKLAPAVQVVVLKNANHLDTFLRPEFCAALKEGLAKHHQAGK
jgi:pimeloyl-ACP methyl ester carboxylesterase